MIELPEISRSASTNQGENRFNTATSSGPTLFHNNITNNSTNTNTNRKSKLIKYVLPGIAITLIVALFVSSGSNSDNTSTSTSSSISSSSMNNIINNDKHSHDQSTEKTNSMIRTNGSISIPEADTISHSQQQQQQLNRESEINHDYHMNMNTLQPTKFHQAGFGALNYHHHVQNGKKEATTINKRYNRYLQKDENIIIPKSATPNAIPSLTYENIVNLVGHYLHDEHRSPFSSKLYNRTTDELQNEQLEYELKMNEIREKWGSWAFRDDQNKIRPIADLNSVEYKDVMNTDFPPNVWQTDPKYVKDFILEGRKLIMRMRLAIEAELGHPIVIEKNEDGTNGISKEDRNEKKELFKIHILEDGENVSTVRRGPGISYMNKGAFNALVRKLLHAMITNDEFYFVLGGHSAAAGHGNDFFQQKTMQFHYIMEPIFHKLGIRLISKNMAQGGLGTLHFSAGQKELYGEKDFLMWDSSMTESYKSLHDIDLFNKQAILNGERVPVIFNEYINNLEQETDGKVWFGDVLSGTGILPKTESIEQGETLPWATQYENCADGVDLCGSRGLNKWDAYCWVQRSDFTPMSLKHGTMCNAKPSGQASWHPGWRNHRFESRKPALVLLKAFEKAFEIWDRGIEKDGFPLNEEYWHVGPLYKDVQGTLHDYINGQGFNTSVCEKHYEPLGFDKWCRTVMHGMTQFTPKNLGDENSIARHMKLPPSGNLPKHEFGDDPSYFGPDLLPLSWKIPDSDVDVHAIAIATNYEAPQVVDEEEGDDDDSIEEAEDQRRLLSKSSLLVVDKEKVIEKQVEERKLDVDDIVPGEGWGISELFEVPTGLCDGSLMSECHRHASNECLLYAHNDGHGGIGGDGLSGWLVINIPEVKAGIIWSKMEWWSVRDWFLTKGKDNNDRNLKKTTPPYPDDFKFEIAINGKVVSTWDKETFMSHSKEVAYNQAMFPLVTDETLSGPVELGLRLGSESDPRAAGLAITHIYYA